MGHPTTNTNQSKNISQIGLFPQISGWKSKNTWNHHPADPYVLDTLMVDLSELRLKQTTKQFAAEKIRGVAADSWGVRCDPWHDPGDSVTKARIFLEML